MSRKQVQIAGHCVTQITESEYEAENRDQGLDFYFDTGRQEAVEVLVFDSRISNHGEKDPYIANFYSSNLETAVNKAMSLTRQSLEGSSLHYNVVERLREVANRLAADSHANTKTVLFPGWHEGYEEGSEQLIKQAAAAILAKGIEPDDGSHVSQEALAALIYYIADMME